MGGAPGAPEAKLFVCVAEAVQGLEWHAARVATPAAGAVSTFSGVTRDSFEGKGVERLEYEAYVPMAEAKLREIALGCISRTDIDALIIPRCSAGVQGGLRVAISHRLGVVPVGEASVLIAVSSAHRGEGLDAVHWAIDELKRRVPIWKKEVYADGSTWKENAQQRRDEMGDS